MALAVIYHSCTAPHETFTPRFFKPTIIDMGTHVGNEAGPPTTDQDLSPAFLAQSLQPNIYAACIIVTVAATIAVGLRLVCRRLSKAYIWWDDWIIIAALVSGKCHKECVTALTDMRLLSGRFLHYCYTRLPP